MNDGDGPRRECPTEPCDGCFIECEPYRALSRGRWYPCSDDLREWARSHRGDLGYVWEGEK